MLTLFGATGVLRINSIGGLDVAFREDHSRATTGYSGENLAVIRHIAVNLLSQEKSAKGGIHAKRLKAGWDDQYLFKVLAQGDNASAKL